MRHHPVLLAGHPHRWTQVLREKSLPLATLTRPPADPATLTRPPADPATLTRPPAGPPRPSPALRHQHHLPFSKVPGAPRRPRPRFPAPRAHPRTRGAPSPAPRGPPGARPFPARARAQRSRGGRRRFPRSAAPAAPRPGRRCGRARPGAALTAGLGGDSRALASGRPRGGSAAPRASARAV